MRPFVILLCTLVPNLGWAQDLVWPALGTHELRATAGAEAVEAVATGLESSGRRVQRLSIESVGVDEPCTEPDCIREQLESHGAERGVFVAVWARTGRARPSEISVTIRSEADEQSGRAEVEGNVADAARRALATALASSTSHTLRVTSAPPGAALTLDGAPAGTTPADLQVSAGRHVISVALDEHQPERRTVEVARDTEIHFALTAVGDTEPPPETRVSGLNYVLGGGLLAGGLVLAIPSLLTVARDGECRSSCGGTLDDGRYQRYSVGGRTIGLLTLSGLLLVGGAIMILARPIRVEASVGAQSAHLRLSTNF